MNADDIEAHKAAQAQIGRELRAGLHAPRGEAEEARADLNAHLERRSIVEVVR